jgi:DNA repair exonuclease SbcCD ATPase subunit
MSAAEDVVVAVRLKAVPHGCPVCGVQFAIPEDLLRRAQDREILRIYCPNGHTMNWDMSEADRLREQIKQLEMAKDRVEREKRWAEQGRDHAQRSANAHKGHVTRLKRRVMNGVCPCCNRSFENLARHMRSKHPDFDPDITNGDAQIA